MDSGQHDETMKDERESQAQSHPVSQLAEESSFWKDHPVLVVLGTVCAAIVTTLAVVNETVLPARMAQAEYELTKANDKIEALKSEIDVVRGDGVASKSALETQIGVLTKDLNSREKKIEELNRSIRRISAEGTFSRDDPLPRGLRSVRIGDSIKDVQTKFQGGQISSVPGWNSVDIENNEFFSSATYYRLQLGEEDTPITHILFHFQFGKEVKAPLLHALSAAYGRPEALEDGAGETNYVWRSVGDWKGMGSYRVELRNSTYLVSLTCDGYSEWAKQVEATCPVERSVEIATGHAAKK